MTIDLRKREKGTNSTLIRVPLDTKKKIDMMRGQLAMNEGRIPSQKEILRRAFNIPTLFDVLDQDSKIKGRGNS